MFRACLGTAGPLLGTAGLGALLKPLPELLTPLLTLTWLAASLVASSILAKRALARRALELTLFTDPEGPPGCLGSSRLRPRKIRSVEALHHRPPTDVRQRRY